MNSDESRDAEAQARRLVSAARAEQASSGLEARLLHGLAERQRLQRLAAPVRRAPRVALAVLGVAVALCAGLAVWAVGTQKSPTFTAEPRLALSVSKPVAPPPLFDPCTRRAAAHGAEPLIDDFEDGNDLPLSSEGRIGKWIWLHDDVTEASPAVPTLRGDARPGNRLAQHVQGGRLRAWGAALQMFFEARCYDAAAYDGISIVARGSGRIYLSVRQIDVVPVSLHGICEHDCFNAHVKKIELTSRWKEYRVPFDEFEQSGYETKPLDATRIHDISVFARPEDTPYDFWIDDLKFLEKKRK
ncbi:MAG: carbohydrate binding domain-containing protein [Polyangiaceae bacterium]